LAADTPGTTGDIRTAAAVIAETEKTELNISAMLAAESKELAILIEIRNTLLKEEASIKRVKAEGVREAITKIANLLNIVLAERPGLRKARRMLVDAVKASGPPQREADLLTVVTESLARQEAGLVSHSQRLEKMDEMLASQAETVVLSQTRENPNGDQEEWTDVVKRRPKNKGAVEQKKAPPQA